MAKVIEETPRSCQCVCHRVGLFGLMCCPCTTKILEDFVSQGARTRDPRSICGCIMCEFHVAAAEIRDKQTGVPQGEENETQ